MILTVPTPFLENAVTGVDPAIELQWIQTNSVALESWLFSSLAELAALENLPEGWDGHHSARINAVATSKARQLLTSFKIGKLPQPVVMPMSGGGVGVHWQAGDRELQLTIYPDGEVLYLGEDIGEEEPLEDGTLPTMFPEKLNRLGMWLIGEL